jgi:hypothetical protein
VKKSDEKNPTTKRTRKAPAHLPDPRGRRGHAAIDDDPALRKFLIEAMQKRPKPTLDDLVDWAADQGFSIGRESVWRFRGALEAEKARKELYGDLARSINEAVPDSNVLEIETALSNLYTTRIFAEVLENELLDAKALELLDAFRKLQSSSSQRERTRFAVDRGVKNATLKIRALMQDLLKKQPDTLRAVLAIVDQATQEARE